VELGFSIYKISIPAELLRSQSFTLLPTEITSPVEAQVVELEYDSHLLSLLHAITLE